MQANLEYALFVWLAPDAELPDLDWGVVVNLVPGSPDVRGNASHEKAVLGGWVAIWVPRGVEVQIQVADVVFICIDGHRGAALEGIRVRLDSWVGFNGWVCHSKRCLGFRLCL